MTFSKDAIIGFLVLLIALGGLFWYLSSRPEGLPAFTPGQGATPEWTDSPQKISESARFYDIEASYPAATPLQASAGLEADAAAVAVMRAWIEETMSEFKANGGFDTLTPQEIELFYRDGRKQELDIDYTVKSDAHTASFIYLIYADTMGAHPNTYYRTFTFDLSTGEELSLSDLFSPGSSYLSVLSEKSRAILAPKMAAQSSVPLDEFDRSYLEDGTEPLSDNFQWFYFEEDAFVLLFPPYQVGPYVFGAQEARIPKAELSAILRAEYR